MVVGNTKTVHRENQLWKPETKDCPTRYMRAQLHLPVQTAPGLRLFSFSFDVGGGLLKQNQRWPEKCGALHALLAKL